jgi:hypothetical protein
MVLADVFDCFAKQSPFAVMTRATLENVFSPERLDAIFDSRSARPARFVVECLGRCPDSSLRSE